MKWIPSSSRLSSNVKSCNYFFNSLLVRQIKYFGFRIAIFIESYSAERFSHCTRRCQILIKIDLVKWNFLTAFECIFMIMPFEWFQLIHHTHLLAISWYAELLILSSFLWIFEQTNSKLHYFIHFAYVSVELFVSINFFFFFFFFRFTFSLWFSLAESNVMYHRFVSLRIFTNFQLWRTNEMRTLWELINFKHTVENYFAICSHAYGISSKLTFFHFPKNFFQMIWVLTRKENHLRLKDSATFFVFLGNKKIDVCVFFLMSFAFKRCYDLPLTWIT